MKAGLFASASAVAVMFAPATAWAQSDTSATAQAGTEATAQSSEAVDERSATQEGEQDILVTATLREVRLQDVPLSVTAYSQEELSELGIVGYEGIAQNTPGIVVNRPTQNFNNFTARGINTNGYSAGLQSPVAIYIDELPISANGNSTILDPNLYDVERVEFLRGPQGTLFGSSSLAGAMRILTRSPDLDSFEGSALVDFGLTDGGLRQRYNAMVNIPIIADGMAFRAVGYYRNEDGWIDNVGTGVEDSNSLEAYGIRALLLMEPSDRLSVRLMASYEDSAPADSSLTNPNLGTYVRRSDQPDLFQGVLQNYNVTVNYDMDFAELISSTTISDYDASFYVDLAGTFAQAFPFALDAFGFDDILVQETRLVSSMSGPLEWVLGFFYYDKRRTVDFFYRSSEEFLIARGLTGLPDPPYYQKFNAYTDQTEIAGFGELTWHITDDFWVTGGLRYTNTTVQSFTRAGGYNSNYLLAAILGLRNIPLTVTPVAAATGLRVEDDSVSWKASVSWRPMPEMTAYATVATGFRPPVVNARAGLPSTINPSDIIIPFGAESDQLTNYEAGIKGTWLGGALGANIAVYYIDWQDIQVQANRVSDSVQFATNIGGAESYGIEFEITARPFTGFTLNLNGSFNEAKVNELTPQEAAISGAEVGTRLASPHFQGSATARYDFALNASTDAYVSANVSHAGSFPNQFPNVPGRPTQVSATYDFTDAWTNVNLYAGVRFDRINLTAYVENLFDASSVTYVHPEAFLDSRYARQRPITFGIRADYQF